MIVITGGALAVVLNDSTLQKLFYKVALVSESVVICRCSPKQKADIAYILKTQYQKVVCCIGDGGNDVGMIKAASVGIGIQGKEGLQASLASDFSIAEFRQSSNLLLWHGRLATIWASNITLFILYRGLLLSIIQSIYSISFYYIQTNIVNENAQSFYVTFFTNFLVISMVINEDMTKEQIYNYPIFYTQSQMGDSLCLKAFLIWVWRASV